MAAETGSAAGIAAITKFGWIKLATLGAAVIGAGIMAIFRPPKNRTELFYQGLVALGTSLLFGNTLADWLNQSANIVNPENLEAYIQYLVSVHGLLGALSWGLFGGVAHIRDGIGKQSFTEYLKKKIIKD